DRQNGRRDDRGKQKRKSNMAKFLPGAGPVNARRFIDLLRNADKSRPKKNHVKRSELPADRGNHRPKSGFFATEPAALQKGKPDEIQSAVQNPLVGFININPQN